MSSPRPSDSSRNQKSSSFPVRFAKSAFFQIFVFFTTVIVLGVAYASWTTLTVSQGADGQPVTQTLMQGIINNINDLQARLSALNPSGTTLSGSSVCINGNCKNSWGSVSSANFGGGWKSFSDGGWACVQANPITGGCTCPVGYISFGWNSDPAGTYSTICFK